MEKRTKIIATLGPASEDELTIENMIKQGGNLFRFNLKHNSLEWHKKIMARVRKVAAKLKIEVGIIVDIQGPELRIETEKGEGLEVKAGELILISNRLVLGKKTIRLTNKKVIDQIKRGDDLYIDDGQLKLQVIEKRGEIIEAMAESDFLIENMKSLNIPGRNLGLEILSDKDKEGLKLAVKEKVDFVALSFVRSKKDIEGLKRQLERLGFGGGVIAKIENERALKNLTSIVALVEGVMIARGDLGVEVPLEQLAYWQKKIIEECRRQSKPVIVATEMLASMVEKIRPSRAEATDVANAVFDGADGLMLSEETAVGKFGVRAVREMANICQFCETKSQLAKIDQVARDASETLAEVAARIIDENNEFKIAGLVVFTASGRTAKLLSAYRLKVPIIAVTDKKEVAGQMRLSYGVIPYFKKFKRDKFNIGGAIFNELGEKNYFVKGDKIVVIHGNNWMSKGSTSSLSIKTV